MKRFQSRRGNGRFTRNTMENTFGLTCYVCAECRSFNPVRVGEARPAICHNCGKPLVDIADVALHASTTGDTRGEKEP